MWASEEKGAVVGGVSIRERGFIAHGKVYFIESPGRYSLQGGQWRWLSSSYLTRFECLGLYFSWYGQELLLEFDTSGEWQLDVLMSDRSTVEVAYGKVARALVWMGSPEVRDMFSFPEPIRLLGILEKVVAYHGPGRLLLS